MIKKLGGEEKAANAILSGKLHALLPAGLWMRSVDADKTERFKFVHADAAVPTSGIKPGTLELWSDFWRDRREAVFIAGEDDDAQIKAAPTLNALAKQFHFEVIQKADSQAFGEYRRLDADRKKLKNVCGRLIASAYAARQRPFFESVVTRFK